MSYELLRLESPANTSSTPSRSGVYRAKNHPVPPLCETGKTLFETFEHSCKTYADLPCLGYRPVGKSGSVGDFTWITYKETNDKVKAFAASLHAAGVTKGSKVAVFGVNCREWMIAMQACNRMGYQCVPLYDTLGENAIEYIIDHSEAAFLVVAAAKLPAFAGALPKITTTLKGVVYWGTDADAGALEKVSALFPVTPFEQAISDGAKLDVAADPPAAEDVCTIMYTSGTTGDPKGVVLTHNALVSCVESVNVYLEEHKLGVGPDDSMLSYLPLAHIFDRTSEELFLSRGGQIGYWQGKLPELVNDIAALRPTQFHGVPRVFDKIYNGINDTLAKAGCVKNMLFKWAYGAKLNRLKSGFPSDKAAPFWDKLVFSKMKARLGGRVKVIVSGGAPLAPHVEEFLKVAMCAPVVQGYGLTETCAASFIAVPDDIATAGTVGPAQPVTSFCLESVPEMKYDALGETIRGEVLIKAPSNFSEYYKMPDKTAEALEDDGWFHTGDIGEITPKGSLRIIDRKKNIFKLSQGEYVAVEKLEADFKKCSYVNQIWVYGNSFESTLVAVVVPKEASMKDWAASNGHDKSDFAALCKLPEAKQFIKQALTEQGKLAKLRGFEFIKNLHLESEEFSAENDLVTPTFKLRRPQLLEYYKTEVDAMYAALKAA